MTRRDLIFNSNKQGFSCLLRWYLFIILSVFCLFCVFCFTTVSGVGISHQPHLSASQRTAVRIIADHVRAVTCLIGDGVLPSAAGRGYGITNYIERSGSWTLALGFCCKFWPRVLFIFLCKPRIFLFLYACIPTSTFFTVLRRIIRRAVRYSTQLQQGSGGVPSMCDCIGALF